MTEEELPPPYSPADEQHRDSTPQPSLRMKPSASSPNLRPSPDSTSRPSLRPAPSASPLSLPQTPDPGLHPSPGPSSNTPLPSPASANDGPSSTLPPSYLDLATFSIGTKSIKKPLVSFEQIKSHLRLLRAFKLFQEKVEDPYSDPGVKDVLPPIGRSIGAKGRWLWFLEMAVERFRRWLLLLATAEGFFITPPVDVWLIWHTYMLNPGWYTEDCERSWFLRPLRDLKEHPMDLTSMGDNILNHRPNVDQEGLWEAGTHLPFDPFVSSATLTDLDVECPRCERTINTSFVNTEGTGFAQPEFVTVCPFCDALVTRESLGVAKFIRDIALDPKDSSHVQMHGKGVYLPGSLLLRSGAMDTYGARVVKDSLRRLHVFRNDDDSGASKLPYHSIELWKKAIGERLGYSGLELRKNIDRAGIGTLKIRRIMGAYVDGKPFSVELVAAAMRHSMFTSKINQLGWLDPEFLGNPESARVLQHCVLRYYGFLTLIRTPPDSGAFFVPTLDIDLMWHTHQLAPVNYSKDCLSIFYRLIDHNDQIEEGNLADGLDMTSKAWEAQFGVPYMYCGCPLQEATFGERLSRATSAFHSKRDRMEPPMNRDDCYSATHPSEHNSVHIIGRSGRRRNARETEWRKRREKEGKKIGKGKGKNKNTELEERYLRGRSHDFPFLMPVPKTHGYGCPHAQKAYAAGCAVGVSGLPKG